MIDQIDDNLLVNYLSITPKSNLVCLIINQCLFDLKM